ncbi:unnamed protein product [Urochloa humidicola]
MKKASTRAARDLAPNSAPARRRRGGADGGGAAVPEPTATQCRARAPSSPSPPGSDHSVYSSSNAATRGSNGRGDARRSLVPTPAAATISLPDFVDLLLSFLFSQNRVLPWEDPNLQDPDAMAEKNLQLMRLNSGVYESNCGGGRSQLRINSGSMKLYSAKHVNLTNLLRFIQRSASFHRPPSAKEDSSSCTRRA